MRRTLACLLAVLAMVAVRCVCRTDKVPRLRIATFNIENFPKSARQIEGAFAEIAKLDAPIVALQEDHRSGGVCKWARVKLGAAWEAELLNTGSVLGHHLGVLYDTRRYKRITTRVHDGTRLGTTHKPVLDVELADTDGKRLRVLVVHFKAGGENQPVRRRQYHALARIVAEVKQSNVPVVLLGDFNATGDADREDLAHVELHWLTEPLACSAFRSYYEESCPRSRLDHVLSTAIAREVRAGGGCETDGCETQASCPLYATEVSDHCPVVVELGI